MHIQFCGAAHEVTGSCHLLDTGTRKILIDCGLFQGSNYTEGKNFDPFPFDPKEIDVMLLTHAHLDHVGRIPKLVREGFRGTIFCTDGTIPLTKIVLEDSARVMEEDHRRYQAPILFTEEDIATALSYFKGVDYDTPTVVIDDISATWRNAGHILGSAFIEIEVGGKKIVFSGDIGNEDAPILKDTAPLGEVDILVTESTYGDKLHEPRDECNQKLMALIVEAVGKGGTVMIPTFSIERTQELLYQLHVFSETNKAFPRVASFVDSPMAIAVAEVFEQFPEYYDREASLEYRRGEDFLTFPGLTLTRSVDDSKRINAVPPPKIIIAGAGMMNGGRILHHAKRHLQEANSTLIIIGYQAEGSLGRKLYEGASVVHILGEDVPVRATVKAIGGLSAHGDQTKLMTWVGSASRKPSKVFCVHGEPTAATTLAHKIRDAYGAECFVPDFGEKMEI